jgi:uncharacterized protein (DUF4415 family)
MPKKPSYQGTVEEDNIEEWTDKDFQRAIPAKEFFTQRLGTQAADAFFETNRKTIANAKRGRPLKPNKKREVKLRIDPDVLDAFKATGKGWQTHMNAVLRDHMPPAP